LQYIVGSVTKQTQCYYNGQKLGRVWTNRKHPPPTGPAVRQVASCTESATRKRKRNFQLLELYATGWTETHFYLQRLQPCRIEQRRIHLAEHSSPSKQTQPHPSQQCSVVTQPRSRRIYSRLSRIQRRGWSFIL